MVRELLREYGLENVSFRSLVVLEQLARAPTETIKGQFY